MTTPEDLVNPLLSDWDEPLLTADAFSTKDGVRVGCTLVFALLLVTTIWASNVGKIDAQASKIGHGSGAQIPCPHSSRSKVVRYGPANP
jgi:hypothetical protein